MKINFKVRMKNKMFWIAIIPAIALLLKQILAVFNVNVDFTNVSKELLAIVESIFIILAILGVVVDPTTAGLSDSTRALGYKDLGGDK